MLVTKPKEKKIQTELYDSYRILFFCMVIVVIVCFYFIYIMGKYILLNSDINVDIPNREQINRYCKQLGYEYGWLDSNNCIQNEVICYRGVGFLKEYKCVEW